MDSTQEIRVRRRMQSWIRSQSASTMTPSPQLTNSFVDLRNFDTTYIKEINRKYLWNLKTCGKGRDMTAEKPQKSIWPKSLTCYFLMRWIITEVLTIIRYPYQRASVVELPLPVQLASRTDIASSRRAVIIEALTGAMNSNTGMRLQICRAACSTG
jgi:hypothetical protein